MPGAPSIETPSELRAALEDARNANIQLNEHLNDANRELETWRRDASRAPEVPPLSLPLPGFAQPSGIAAAALDAKPEPEPVDEERLHMVAIAINADREVPLEDLRWFHGVCKFRKLEGDMVDAYARAGDLLRGVDNA
jgi:hypothetical protein